MTTLTAAAPRTGRRSRLAGVDAARGLAVLGMVAAHVLPSTTDDGGVTLPEQIAGGRSSAAFAVLAGVGVALATRRGTDRWAQRLRLLLRALLIGALGLWLGGLDVDVAVILAYYAVFFVLLLPFLGWPPRRLLVAAATEALTAPVLSYLVRPRLPAGDFANPTWSSLSDPGDLLSDLLLAGVYPAVPWAAYLLTGLAVGQLALDRTATAVRLAAAGAALWAAAAAASACCSARSGATRRSGRRSARRHGHDRHRGGAGGDRPHVLRQRPDRQLVAAGGRRPPQQHDPRPRRHHRHGAAGARRVPARDPPGPGLLLAPLAAVGSMPLTVYSRPPARPAPDRQRRPHPLLLPAGRGGPRPGAAVAAVRRPGSAGGAPGARRQDCPDPHVGSLHGLAGPLQRRPPGPRAGAAGKALDVDEATVLLGVTGSDLDALLAVAGRVRDAGLVDAGRPGVVTYSRKVFVPLTRLCRDRCHYCTFATVPDACPRRSCPSTRSSSSPAGARPSGARRHCSPSATGPSSAGTPPAPGSTRPATTARWPTSGRARSPCWSRRGCCPTSTPA
jgi:uncharacterized membrane protein